MPKITDPFAHIDMRYVQSLTHTVETPADIARLCKNTAVAELWEELTEHTFAVQACHDDPDVAIWAKAAEWEDTFTDFENANTSR